MHLAVRHFFSVLVLAYIVLSLFFFPPFDRTWKWWAALILIYSVPVICQFFSNVYLRVFSLWVGAAFVVQAFAPIVADWIPSSEDGLIYLEPEFERTIDVQPGALPGIDGIQHISTDHMGFRVLPPIDYSDNSAYRIFTIGGSTTEDIYLDDQRTWSHLLQEGLRKNWRKPVEVVNTGVSGLYSDNHVATLAHIRDLNPDAAVFLLGFNDWARAVRARFKDTGSSTPEDFLDEETFAQIFDYQKTPMGQGLTKLWLLAKGEETEPSVYKETGIYYKKRRGSLFRPHVIDYRPDNPDERFRNNLIKLSDMCRDMDIECIFVTQPVGYSHEASAEFKAGFWATPAKAKFSLNLDSLIHVNRTYNDYLRAFSRDHEHLLCDLAPELRPSYEHFYDDVHFNTMGARAVAEFLTRCVSRNIDAAGRRLGSP